MSFIYYNQWLLDRLKDIKTAMLAFKVARADLKIEIDQARKAALEKLMEGLGYISVAFVKLILDT